MGVEALHQAKERAVVVYDYFTTLYDYMAMKKFVMEGQHARERQKA